MIRIESPRYGSLEVDPERVIEFPAGLVGFEDCKRYTLFHPEDDAGGERGEDAAPRYFILQSLDDPTVAFHIADPAVFGFDFEVKLSDEEAALLRLADPEKAAVVVILSRGGKGVRANLRAPLILNLDARLGLQHVFSGLEYDVSVKGH